MPKQVVNGAIIFCDFGLLPSSLVVLPANKVNVGGVPAANIMDYQPVANIPSFGMCLSLTNPTVASATSAASGVFTPMPCKPNTVTPWIPGSPTVLIAYMPALNDTSTCKCAWGGTISVIGPGQATTDIP
jgi:hypothetical protein